MTLPTASPSARSSLPGRCEKCVQPTCPVVQGFGVGGGLAIVGEAPGASEVQRGQPFVGESGRLIRTTLEALGQDPNDVYWTNAVMCRPPGNKTPTQTLIRSCNQRLLDIELPLVSPTKILTLGGVALTATLGAAKVLPITKWRGRGLWTSYGGEAGAERPYQAYMVPTYHPAAVMRDPDLFRDFADDIHKLLNNDAPFAPPNVDVSVAHDEATAIMWLESLMDVSVLSCDLETTGFNPITDTILSVGFGVTASVMVDPGSLDGWSLIIPISIANKFSVKRAIKDLLVKRQKPLGFHNAKFDLQFLHQFYEGTPIRPPYLVDTMLLHYGLDERPIGRYRAHGLKDLARVHYDADDYAWDFPAFYATPEADRDYAGLYYYQGLDTYYTAKLMEDLTLEATSDSPRSLELMSNLLWPAAQAFSEIELRGLGVDVPYFEAFKGRVEHQIEEIGDRLQKVVFDTTGIENFNPNSPLQAQEVIFHRWNLPKGTGTWYGGRETGTESTGKVALQFLTKKTNDPVIISAIEDIIEYRTRTKVLSTYIVGILDLMDHDRRLRSDFRLAGTATGRLSSAEPNLQNIPVQRLGPEIRDGFIPTDGYVFLEADYSQLELRVAAWYSQDEAMMQTFRDGKDIHRIVAAKMFRKPESEITKFQRYMAKFVDFGILYGRQAKSLTEGQEVEWLEEQGVPRWTLQEAEFFLKEFLDGFPGLAQWMIEQKARALRDKVVTTEMGRYRRFPLIPTSERGSVERQAVNTPIQSLASDVCLRSLVKLHYELPEGAYVLFPIHDSILFEVREDLVDEMIPYIKKTMEGGFPFPSTVPFPVDVKIGVRWGSLEEVPGGE